MTIRAIATGGAVLARRRVVLACGGTPGDFLLRTDRAVYRAGQTITLTAQGGGVEPVFVDFIKDGQTLVSETVEMNDGKGEHAFDLPPDLFGTIQLVAYRFTPAGAPLRKIRVLYVSPADGLKIQAALDKNEYRPGREATLRLSLTDAAGKPTPGAVSLAAVDEAVFALMSQRPGMEQTFCNLERDLLKPVYALYPWTPDANAGAGQRDRALFASTARSINHKAGPHSLAASSFPDKEKRVLELRAKRLNAVHLGWVGLILASMLLAYAAVWSLPLANVLKIHGAAWLLLVPLGLLGVLGWTLIPEAPQARIFRDDRAGAILRHHGLDLTNTDLGLDDRLPLAYNVDRLEEVSVPGLLAEVAAAWTPCSRPAPAAVLPRDAPLAAATDHRRSGQIAAVPIDLADSITTWRLGGQRRLGRRPTRRRAVADQGLSAVLRRSRSARVR